MTHQTYKSEIVLGERYRDTATGFEGVCTAVTFFQHGCERLTIKGMNRQGDIKDYAFDAPEVELAKTSTPVRVVEPKTGGPHDRAGVSRR